MSGSLLAVDGLCAGYGRVQILKRISFEVPQGEAIALVGPNGAGKTTLLRAVSGFLPISEGSVHLGGRDVGGREAHQLVKLGMSHVLQGRHVVAGMSVEDNLMLGAHVNMTRRRRDKVKDDLFKSLQLFPALDDRRRQSADSLSGGEQQMLAIARALMARPRVLLLDEPSMGLAPRIVNEIGDALINLKSEGLTIVLVEQNPDLAVALADRVAVVEAGEIVEVGTVSLIEDREKVALAYLGQEDSNE